MLYFIISTKSSIPLIAVSISFLTLLFNYIIYRKSALRYNRKLLATKAEKIELDRIKAELSRDIKENAKILITKADSTKLEKLEEKIRTILTKSEDRIEKNISLHYSQIKDFQHEQMAMIETIDRKVDYIHKRHWKE